MMVGWCRFGVRSFFPPVLLCSRYSSSVRFSPLSRLLPPISPPCSRPPSLQVDVRYRNYDSARYNLSVTRDKHTNEIVFRRRSRMVIQQPPWAFKPDDDQTADSTAASPHAASSSSSSSASSSSPTQSDGSMSARKLRRRKMRKSAEQQASTCHWRVPQLVLT